MCRGGREGQRFQFDTSRSKWLECGVQNDWMLFSRIFVPTRDWLFSFLRKNYQLICCNSEGGEDFKKFSKKKKKKRISSPLKGSLKGSPCDSLQVLWLQIKVSCHVLFLSQSMDYYLPLSGMNSEMQRLVRHLSNEAVDDWWVFLKVGIMLPFSLI